VDQVCRIEDKSERLPLIVCPLSTQMRLPNPEANRQQSDFVREAAVSILAIPLLENLLNMF
jgi:hypothetical protein